MQGKVGWGVSGRAQGRVLAQVHSARVLTGLTYRKHHPPPPSIPPPPPGGPSPSPTLFSDCLSRSARVRLRESGIHKASALPSSPGSNYVPNHQDASHPDIRRSLGSFLLQATHGLHLVCAHHRLDDKGPSLFASLSFTRLFARVASLPEPTAGKHTSSPSRHQLRSRPTCLPSDPLTSRRARAPRPAGPFLRCQTGAKGQRAASDARRRSR